MKLTRPGYGSAQPRPVGQHEEIPGALISGVLHVEVEEVELHGTHRRICSVDAESAALVCRIRGRISGRSEASGQGAHLLITGTC